MQPLSPDGSRLGLAVSRHRLATALLVTALCAFTAASLQPVFGLHHDDGIYLASGQSLARGEGYVVASLPHTPPATKYPPFYPVLASVVFLVRPSIPDAVYALKIVNVGCYAAALVLFHAFSCRRLGDGWNAVALTASLGMAPIVVKFLDYTMTESVFLALTMALLHVWDPTIAGRRRPATAIVLLAAMLATRAIALGFGAAITLDAMRRGRRGLAVATSGVTIGWTVLWHLVRPVSASPLLDYYLAYEPSLLALLIENPVQALGAMLDTVRHFRDGLHFVVGPGWSLLPCVALAAAGAWVRRASVEVAVAVCVCALLLIYPGASPRYLLPLVPIYLLLAVEGARAISRWAGMPDRGVLIGSVLLTMASAVPFPASVTWHPRVLTEDRWAGFLEAGQWLGSHTPPDALVASGYDTLYYLASGRRGLRPWRHDLFSQFHPYPRATPRVGDAVSIRAELRALGVDYLVVEPMDFHLEGPAVEAMLHELVGIEPAATPVFSNDGGRRVVYRLAP